MIVVEDRVRPFCVHRDMVMACVRLPDDAGCRREEVQQFSTTSNGLLRLAGWLVERGVGLVGMEATGIYWKLRNVPGRKTDVGDRIALGIVGWHVPRQQRVRRRTEIRSDPSRIEVVADRPDRSTHAAARSKDTYLAAHYHRIADAAAHPRAAVAAGHSILVICRHLLSTGETYNDLGGDYLDKRRTSTAHQRRLIAQLEAIGLDVTVTPKAA